MLLLLGNDRFRWCTPERIVSGKDHSAKNSHYRTCKKRPDKKLFVVDHRPDNECGDRRNQHTGHKNSERIIQHTSGDTAYKDPDINCRSVTVDHRNQQGRHSKRQNQENDPLRSTADISQQEKSRGDHPCHQETVQNDPAPDPDRSGIICDLRILMIHIQCNKHQQNKKDAQPVQHHSRTAAALRIRLKRIAVRPVKLHVFPRQLIGLCQQQLPRLDLPVCLRFLDRLSLMLLSQLIVRKQVFCYDPVQIGSKWGVFEIPVKNMVFINITQDLTDQAGFPVIFCMFHRDLTGTAATQNKEFLVGAQFVVSGMGQDPAPHTIFPGFPQNIQLFGIHQRADRLLFLVQQFKIFGFINACLVSGVFYLFFQLFDKIIQRGERLHHFLLILPETARSRLGSKLSRRL